MNQRPKRKPSSSVSQRTQTPRITSVQNWFL